MLVVLLALIAAWSADAGNGVVEITGQGVLDWLQAFVGDEPLPGVITAATVATIISGTDLFTASE